MVGKRTFAGCRIAGGADSSWARENRMLTQCCLRNLEAGQFDGVGDLRRDRLGRSKARRFNCVGWVATVKRSSGNGASFGQL